MKVIILAAGYATRLYPLTLNQPKPLLNVAGKPMVDHVIDNLTTIPDIDVVYVVTNDKFADHFQRGPTIIRTRTILVLKSLTTAPRTKQTDSVQSVT